MMKKVLVLLTVLALAVMANAAMVLNIQVGDSIEVEEVTLFPSDHITLGIYASAGFVDGDGMFFALTTDNALGLVSGGTIISPPAPNYTIFVDAVDYAEYFPGLPGIYGSIDTSSSGGTGGIGVYIGSIDFHCQGEGDVMVSLWTTDWENPQLLDSVLIHQIPEPMTLALLSLGGLLLRKRS